MKHIKKFDQCLKVLIGQLKMIRYTYNTEENEKYRTEFEGMKNIMEIIWSDVEIHWSTIDRISFSIVLIFEKCEVRIDIDDPEVWHYSYKNEDEDSYDNHIYFKK